MIDFFCNCQPLAGMAMGKFSFDEFNDSINYGAEVIETSTSSLVSVMGADDAERHGASVQSIQITQGIRALNDERQLTDWAPIYCHQDYKQKDKDSFINHALKIINQHDNDFIYSVINRTEPGNFMYIPRNLEEVYICKCNIEYMVHLLSFNDYPICVYNYAPPYLKHLVYTQEDVRGVNIYDECCDMVRNRIKEGLKHIENSYMQRIKWYIENLGIDINRAEKFKYTPFYLSTEEQKLLPLYEEIGLFQKFVHGSISSIKDDLFRYSASFGNTYHLYNWIIYRFIAIVAKSYNFAYHSEELTKISKLSTFPIINGKSLTSVIPGVLMDPNSKNFPPYHNIPD